LGEVTACGLCGFEPLAFVNRDKRREFYLCGGCGLVSVPERYRLSVDDERARYGLHDNTMSNEGYVRFLSQVADVAAGLWRSGMRVLDFGCGENAALCRLLGDKGIDCCAYDPLYGRLLPGSAYINGVNNINNNDADNSGQSGMIYPSNPCRFDMIILCEVIEHLRDISGELNFIGQLLRDGGTIILRTQVYENLSVFPGWWYAQDPTHINFFNRQALRKAAAIINKNLVNTDYPDIFVLSLK
jgi:2-polyprenyl-3-methyl-5-hydroxy-6-metoxy-1,4-benzoquinol methylase